MPLAALRTIKGRSVNVFVAFGDSSNLSVRMWINTPEQSVYNKKRSYHPNQKSMMNDIMIPFPIRTLDFEIAGTT
jgi:hypothetical protein